MTHGHSGPITTASQEMGGWGKEAARGDPGCVVGGASGCECGAPGSGAELSRSACNLAGFAETAVNIGFACQLLSENMLILEDKDIK